jgi:hypothetical protein
MRLVPRRAGQLALVAAIAALPLAAVAGWPIGSRLDRSVVVDVTAEGFGSLQGLLGSFIPPRIEVPNIDQADESGCVFGVCTYGYDLLVQNMYVEVQIDSLDLAPANGNVLNLDADATITLNSPADPATLDISAELFGAEIIDDTCDLYVNPIGVALSGPIQLSLVDDAGGVDVDGDGLPDTKMLDVVVPPVTWAWDASGDDIQFTNCGLASVVNTVNTVTGFFGFDLYDLILDQFTPTIDELVTELPAQIEPLLEDTFSQLTISEEIDLLGVPLTFTLWPNGLATNPDGMRLELSSVTDVPRDPCVARFGISDSPETASTFPPIGQTPSGLPFAPHAQAIVDDDFVNHVLYGVWAGGLLCYTLPDPTGELELPLAIDASLLSLLAPGAFDDIVADRAPMQIITAPTKPPHLDTAGANDVNVKVDDLGLGFFVEVDGRRTRLMNIDVAADLGVDLDYDGNVGELAIGLDLAAGAFVPTVTANEFKPEATAQIEASFGGLFDTLVGPLLGGVTEGMVVGIPSFEGLGLTELMLEPTGDQGEMLGAYVQTGIVPFYSAGCDESGGCTSGCEGGCTTGALPGRLILLFPLLLAGLRRRSVG